MAQDSVLGIDIGGSGIKGALVDVGKGELITERFRLETPRPANPKNVTQTFKKVVEHFNYKGPIGCGFPAVMKKGVAYSASNIHDDWIGTNAAQLFSDATGCEVSVLNDADVAGVAEVKFGVGKGVEGTVILITIGTGLGSAIFLDGQLLPNTEFGHVYLKGHKEVAERYASNSARKRDGLKYSDWANRFKEYLEHLQFLFTPDLFILGGGASKKYDKFDDVLASIRTPIATAEMLNEAGIIGAAVASMKP
ncbi:MAG: ROK family protein [Bacteroidota bacterium]